MSVISSILKSIFLPKGGQPSRRNRKSRRNIKGSGNNFRRFPKSKRPIYQSMRNQNSQSQLTSRHSGKVAAYHGTPKLDNIKSILKEGWIIGRGNNYGDGIYLAKDLKTAKSYAGSSGFYLKCMVTLGKSCNWRPDVQKQYADWCKKNGVQQDNSAITAFLIRHGFNTLINGNIILVLSPQYANPSAWKCRNKRIQILSIHRASDDCRIRV